MLEQILNGIVPVMVYTLVGLVLGLTGVFSPREHQILITLTFTLYFPISTIYSLGRKEITGQDLQLAGCYYVSSALVIVVLYVLSKTLYRKRTATAFAHLSANVLIQNIIVTGLPIASGFYDPNVVEKYGYIIAFAQFTSTIPIALYLFEYAALVEAHGGRRLPLREIGKLVVKSLWKTIKNPMMLGIFGALLYNLVKMLWVPSLAELPVYLSDFFLMLRTLVNSFGIFAIGIFTSNEILKASARKKEVPVIVMPSFQPAVEDNLTGDEPIAIRQPSATHEPAGKLPTWANLLIQLALRHVIFPILQIICMRILRLPDDIVRVNAALSTCNTGLQAFALSNAADFDPIVSGLMILIGMFIEVALTPVLDWAAGI